VRSIVVGGVPTPGPMQAASGSRGARSDSSETLDGLFSTVLELNLGAAVPRGRDPGMSLISASLTLRDQMRKGNPTPLQYTYVAADCRLYFTLDNVFNMTSLWHDVSEAAWGKKKLCVEGSVGYASHGDVAPELPPPELSVTAPPSPAFELGIDLDAGEIGEGITAGQVALQGTVGVGQPCTLVPCAPGAICQETQCVYGSFCRQVKLFCPPKPDPLNPNILRPQPIFPTVCIAGCDTQQPWMCEQGGVNACVGDKRLPSRNQPPPPALGSQRRPLQGAPNAQGPITSRQIKGKIPPSRIPPTGPAIPPAKQPMNPGVVPPNQQPGRNFQSGRTPPSQLGFRVTTQQGTCLPRRATAQMGCV
jgi:hypothetical protein